MKKMLSTPTAVLAGLAAMLALSSGATLAQTAPTAAPSAPSLSNLSNGAATATDDTGCYLTLPLGVNMGVQAVYAKSGQPRDLCFIQGAGDVTRQILDAPAGWTLAASGNRLTVTAGPGAQRSRLSVRTAQGEWRFALMPQN